MHPDPHRRTRLRSNLIIFCHSISCQISGEAAATWPEPDLAADQRCFRNADVHADLAIAAFFQVIHAYRRSFGAGQLRQQALHFFLIGRNHFACIAIANGIIGQTDLARALNLGQLSNRNPPSHDDQVSAQRTLAPKTTQRAKVLIDQQQEHIGYYIVAHRFGQSNRAAQSDFADYVRDQAYVAIDEIFPGFGFSCKQRASKSRSRFDKTTCSAFGQEGNAGKKPPVHIR